MSKERKPGEVPPNKLAVVNHSGNIVGHMGKQAGAPTAARFTGNPNMKLGKHKGKAAWIEQDKAAPKPQPPESANHKSARGSVRAPNKGK